MSFDDRLPDLLSDAARGADQVPPTAAGVQRAIGRRAVRRRRQRIVGGVAGGLFILACVGGGLALSATGGDDNADVAAPSGWEGDLPYVGLEIPGFHLERTEGEQPPETAPPGLDLEVVLFTDGSGSATGPVLQAARVPESESAEEDRSEPVDLDGDGVTGGPDDGLLVVDGLTNGVVWQLGDGQQASVAAMGLTPDELLAYARDLDRSTFDPLTVPNPDGLPQRAVLDLIDGYRQSAVYYTGEELADGSYWTFHVLTLDQPAYFDLLRMTSTDDEPFAEIPLGDDSFLGPGVALIRQDPGGDGNALIRTESGLMIQVVGPQVALLREAIEAGRFVDLDPVDVPASTTTTAVPPVTTGPDSDIGAAGSGTADGSTNLTGLWVERIDEGRARVVIEFDTGIPPWEVSVGSAPQLGGEGSCALAQPAADVWLNVVLGRPGGGGVAGSQLRAGHFDDLDDDNPTFSGITATLTCEPFEGAARVDVSLPAPIPRPEEIEVLEAAEPNRLVLIVHL